MSGIPGARQNKILLVDGDFRSSHRLATLLSEDGYDVEVVRDAAAAIVRLGRAPLLDTLITELKVPLGDGAALARYARSQASSLPQPGRARRLRRSAADVVGQTSRLPMFARNVERPTTIP
jgi:CheY-like chemotaxis protein